MPNTDHDPMDPGFEWRLKAALDRITPPASRPRYASASMGGVRSWRIAPVLLAGATAVLLAVTATAATGSPNPIVWTQRAASTIESVGHAPEASPSPEPSPERSEETPNGGAAAQPTNEPEHEASPSPEPSEHSEQSPEPEPTTSPSPSEDHGGSSSPSPSPSPTDDHGGSSSPSPSPGTDDH
jgi:outer membrane biosynthesis protein TonB